MSPGSMDQESASRRWKVGELASKTGLTVRTLHHYDALGLLIPSDRTDSNHGSGHRLYTADDVTRLQQIISLKQLGFSLDQIKEYLRRQDYDPREVIRLHLRQIRGQAAELKRLEVRLSALAESFESAEMVSADVFLATIEEMTMLEKYYTPEQLQTLQSRRTEAAAMGKELIQQGPQMWAELQADVQAALVAGIEPSDPKAQVLARRWFALIEVFTGGDSGLFNSLNRMYQNEATVHGMDVGKMRPAMEWIEQAGIAAGIRVPK